MIQRLVPHPLTSVAIVALWMLLAETPSIGNFLLALFLALLLPWLMTGFWPDRIVVVRPLMALRLLCVFIFDILVANWVVARLVVGPTDRLKSQFVEVPLDVHDTFVATLLASALALTPGTVSIDVDQERWVLLLHALHVEDEGSLIATIKGRYEAPMREIFGC
jgi:multicomponent K+:H+ antiporter subunit E